MDGALIDKLEELGLAEQGVVSPAQKMFAQMRQGPQSSATNEYENARVLRGNAIPMLSTTLAGTAAIDDYRHVLDELHPSDTLELVRDPSNEVDEHAVALIDAKGRKVGFLPHGDNETVSNLMDAGKQLFAQVANIDEKHHWAEVAITVFLQD